MKLRLIQRKQTVKGLESKVAAIALLQKGRSAKLTCPVGQSQTESFPLTFTTLVTWRQGIWSWWRSVNWTISTHICSRDTAWGLKTGCRHCSCTLNCSVIVQLTLWMDYSSAFIVPLSLLTLSSCNGIVKQPNNQKMNYSTSFQTGMIAWL
jgi:hypothetical protein